jgi:hypothetical protein
MSIKGPVPKEASERVRRSRDTFTPTKAITPDGKLRGPALPKGITWCQRTTRWWAAWRRSPQAQLMLDTDWEAMLEAAFIHNTLWTDPDDLSVSELTALTKELHRILGSYGLTYGDRLKLRIKIDDDKPASKVVSTVSSSASLPDNVVSMYRQKLGVSA